MRALTQVFLSAFHVFTMAFPSILRQLFAAAYLCQFIFVSSVYAINGNVDWTPTSPARPNGKTLDARTASINDGNWFTMTAIENVGFSLGSTVGYRLSADYSNVVVLKSEEWNEPITANFYGPPDAPHMQNELEVGNVIFTETLNPNATSGEIWNSSIPFTNLPVVIAFRTTQGECIDTKTLTISTLDGNGVYQSFTGINDVSGTVGSALPIQVNVTFLESPEYNAAITYNPSLNSIQYLVGEGNPFPPVVPDAVLTTTFFLCH